MGDAVEHDADHLLDRVISAGVCIELATEKLGHALKEKEKSILHNLTGEFRSKQSVRSALVTKFGQVMEARAKAAKGAEAAEAAYFAEDRTTLAGAERSSSTKAYSLFAVVAVASTTAYFTRRAFHNGGRELKQPLLLVA
jgi:hypothetical protein